MGWVQCSMNCFKELKNQTGGMTQFVEYIKKAEELYQLTEEAEEKGLYRNFVYAFRLVKLTPNSYRLPITASFVIVPLHFCHLVTQVMVKGFLVKTHLRCVNYVIH